jgi:FkbM family methyltransferase
MGLSVGQYIARLTDRVIGLAPRVDGVPPYEPIKWRIEDALCNPVFGWLFRVACHDRIRCRDFIVDVRSDMVTLSTVARLFWGFYEGYELEFIRRFLERDVDVIELGSSLGVTSCSIRRILENKRKLVCVEANPNLISILRLNLALNFPGRHMPIVNAAIDSTKGRSEVEIELNRNSLFSKLAADPDSARPTCVVPTTTLSRLIRDHEIGDYALVCDIEGAEAGIIMCNQVDLGRCRQVIIELHSMVLDGLTVSVEQLSETLQRRHGFRLRARRGHVFVFERA